MMEKSAKEEYTNASISTKGRSGRTDLFEQNFPILEEACILIRVLTSICQGLAINTGVVSNCFFRNSL